MKVCMLCIFWPLWCLLLSNALVFLEISIESSPIYRMAGFLGIARKRCTFYRKRKFLESAEHIHKLGNWFTIFVYYYYCYYSYISRAEMIKQVSKKCVVYMVKPGSQYYAGTASIMSQEKVFFSLVKLYPWRFDNLIGCMLANAGNTMLE